MEMSQEWTEGQEPPQGSEHLPQTISVAHDQPLQDEIQTFVFFNADKGFSYLSYDEAGAITGLSHFIWNKPQFLSGTFCKVSLRHEESSQQVADVKPIIATGNVFSGNENYIISVCKRPELIPEPRRLRFVCNRLFDNHHNRSPGLIIDRSEAKSNRYERNAAVTFFQRLQLTIGTYRIC